MKKLFLTIVGLGLLVNLHATQIKVSEVLNNYMAAWNEHSLTKIEAFYAEDVIWYDLTYDATTRGKKKVSKAITDAFLGSVPDMYWVKSGDVFISGNTIIYEWVYGGTFSGEFDGVTIKNKKFEIKGVSTTTINSAGKIIKHKDYYDLLNFKYQVTAL